MTLKVDRVGKLHTAANALPGLRTHQLQLALHDMAVHHYHAGQHLWLRPQCDTTAPSLSLPAPVWLMVQVWAHAAVVAGAARVQLTSSASTLYAAPIVQVGDMVTVQPLTAPLLPASAITLRRLITDGTAENDTGSLDNNSASTPSSTSSFQPAIDSFISAALSNRPCHIGMAVSVELFNTTHHLVIDAVEPAPCKADPSASPVAYIVSANTVITLNKHSTPLVAKQPTTENQTVDFCQSAASLTQRTSLLSLVAAVFAILSMA